MIDLDYRRTTPKRILTPGEKAAVIASSKDLAEQGYPVQQEYLTGDFDSLGGGDGGGFWDHAVMVRTADGTWQMSYRSFCRRVDTSINLVDFRCPDGPTLHFPTRRFMTGASCHPTPAVTSRPP